MKVTVYTEPHEAEADVSLEDCISELLSRSDDKSQRRKMSAIDGATKVLERLDPPCIAGHLERYPESVKLIRKRLQKWIDATEPK